MTGALKSTPSPWMADTGSVKMQSGEMSFWLDGGFCGQGHSNPESESEANVQLAATAPELYKYLEIALSIIGQSKLVWMGEDAARAVLAKARGDDR